MKKIAVVYKKDNSPNFLDILKNENIEFTTLTTSDISILKDYDIIFINTEHKEMLKAINRIKLLNENVIVVATSENSSDINIQEAISSGANDFIKQDIDRKTFLNRLDYYKIASNYQQNNTIKYDVYLDDKPHNLFTKNIFKRSIKFEIDKEDKLVEAWDYLVYYANSQSNLCGLRLFFSIAEWIVKNSNKYSIIYEENDDNHYITICYKPIPKKTISNLISKHCTFGNIQFDDKKITARLEKQTSKQKNNLLQKEKNKKKINAKEFMESTPLEVAAKLDILEDLEDSLTLEINNFNINNSKESLKIVSEFFREYSNIIFLLNEFEKLSEAINGMADAIEEIDEKVLDKDETVGVIISLLYFLIDDLSNWRTKVFVNQEAQDIHYLDDSLLASCTQIKDILQKGDSSEENDEYKDIELF